MLPPLVARVRAAVDGANQGVGQHRRVQLRGHLFGAVRHQLRRFLAQRSIVRQHRLGVAGWRRVAADDGQRRLLVALAQFARHAVGRHA
ncbi:hypothetical protein LP420_24815 [Massilia sp. B-10]|nr:hypothetical protein LP420_24815 [Massilia sp. B-10]